MVFWSFRKPPCTRGKRCRGPSSPGAPHASSPPAGRSDTPAGPAGAPPKVSVTGGLRTHGTAGRWCVPEPHAHRRTVGGTRHTQSVVLPGRAVRSPVGLRSTPEPIQRPVGLSTAGTPQGDAASRHGGCEGTRGAPGPHLRQDGGQQPHLMPPVPHHCAILNERHQHGPARATRPDAQGAADARRYPCPGSKGRTPPRPRGRERTDREVVDGIGIEPTTSALRTRRSPS